MDSAIFNHDPGMHPQRLLLRYCDRERLQCRIAGGSQVRYNFLISRLQLQRTLVTAPPAWACVKAIDATPIMEPLESQTHSFIVKIWRERGGRQGTLTSMRGHITHVPGGERASLRSLGDIADFIRPYVETAEERRRGNRWVRLWSWWRRAK